MTSSILTAERLRELFHYNSETGVLTRLVRTSNSVKVGDVAGWLTSEGYIRIRVDGRPHMAHRLAWLYIHGRFPPAETDHANGIRDDNRIINLRAVTNGENQQNQRRARSNSASGLLGACWSAPHRKWRAKIKLNGKMLHIGLFSTAELAHAAYVAAKRELHPMGML